MVSTERPFVRLPKLHEQIADAITTMIVESRIAEGEFLPTEKQLAERFGVSRAAVREATKGLAAKGLVEVIHGRGVRVKGAVGRQVAGALELLLRRKATTLGELWEVRQTLECEVAALAAARATWEDLQAMRDALDAIRVVNRPMEVYVEADRAFHAALFCAAHNAVFELVLEALAGLLQESIRTTLSLSGVQLALSGHERVQEAVEARDAERARAAMRQHLLEARATLDRVGTVSADEPVVSNLGISFD
ncbi:MAG: FadR family transcriptional regulator [Chloroflexi bacterium]|nr:FadR family transcriptional regulator [Chloroflexota bacterium]